MRRYNPKRFCLLGYRSLFAAIAVAAAVILCGCNKKNDAKKEVESIVLPVTATKVSRGRIEKYLTYTGNVDAVKRVAIAPAMPGKIERILVDEGSTVSEGQLLVRMDDKSLIQAGAQYESAKKMYQRINSLYERSSATAQQLDQALAAFEAAQAGYEQIRSSVELRAPFSGTIIGKYYNEGEIYSSMKPTPEGLGAILSMANLRNMKIEVSVPEQDYVQIKVGKMALVGIDALGNRKFTGIVGRVSPAIDMRSRTATVTIEIDNDETLIRPGMFGRVRIVTESKDSVLTVPTQSVVIRNDSAFVFKVRTGTPPYDAVPVPAAVRIGLVNDDYSEISGGEISEGDLVLSENNVSLTKETAVRVTKIAGSEGM